MHKRIIKLEIGITRKHERDKEEEAAKHEHNISMMRNNALHCRCWCCRFYCCCFCRTCIGRPSNHRTNNINNRTVCNSSAHLRIHNTRAHMLYSWARDICSRIALKKGRRDTDTRTNTHTQNESFHYGNRYEERKNRG